MFFSSGASALALLSFALPAIAQNQPDLAQRCQHIPFWQTCQGLTAQQTNLECATIKVARDWTVAKTSDDEIYLRLIRYKATVNPDTAESIIINPGGPGQSGINTVLNGGAFYNIVSGGRYHIIGFDPRGVGQNMPYNCNAQPTSATDPNADADTNLANGYIQYAQTCAQQAGELGNIIYTVQTAKDVIAIARAVGVNDKLVRYWGFSYGTLLGNTIARIVPNEIGGMILDGNIDPNDYYYSITTKQYDDTDKSIQQFFSLCSQANAQTPGSCAWTGLNGDNSFNGMLTKWTNWVGIQPNAANRGRVNSPLDDPDPTPEAAALANSRSSIVRLLTFTNMYLPAQFKNLAVTLDNWYNNRDNIQSGFVVNSSGLLSSKLNSTQSLYRNVIRRQTYTGADPNFSPNTKFTMNNALDGIRCSDTRYHPAATGPQYRSFIDQYNTKSPYTGDLINGPSLRCTPWVNQAKEYWTAQFGGITTSPAPIVFVQTYFDPVTSKTWGDAAKSYWTNAVIVYTNGEGHCSPAHTSQTLNAALNSYWSSGTAPTNGNTYGVVNPNPFLGAAQVSQPLASSASAPAGGPSAESAGADFLSRRDVDTSYLFDGLHVPKKRDLSLEFEGLTRLSKRAEVDPDLDYGICTDNEATSTTSGTSTGASTTSGATTTGTSSASTTTGTGAVSTTTGTGAVSTSTYTVSATGTATTTSTGKGYTTSSYVWKPSGVTDTYSSWATWMTWKSTPAASTWSTWDPKVTPLSTWKSKTDGWEVWTSQDDCIPVTKTICGKDVSCMTKVVAVPTKTVYVDYVDDVCETGITTKIITVTATCAMGCEAKPTGVPQGYTTTAVYCGACATPSTVIVTTKDANWSPVPVTPVAPATSVKPAEWSPATSVPVKPAATETWSPIGKYTGAASTVSVACSSLVGAILAAIWIL